MKLKILNDNDPKPLEPKQREDWNNYVNWLEKKGYKGSPLLDKKETGLARNLFDQFIKENPKSTINYETVKSVQYEMQKLRDAAQGFAARRNDPNAKNIMSGVSKLDGWPGSKTTSFKFPSMSEKQYYNNALQSQKNLGIVNPELKPATALAMKPVPAGVKIEKMSDGHFYYEDPSSGQLVFYK